MPRGSRSILVTPWPRPPTRARERLEVPRRLVIALKQPAPHPHGDPWWACEEERRPIEAKLKEGLRLTKVRKLLTRSSVHVPYSTLYRFAVQELGLGSKGMTVPVADDKPGHELQVDTGWVLSLEPDEGGVRRRKKAPSTVPARDAAAR